jgi:hypothetical protein
LKKILLLLILSLFFCSCGWFKRKPEIALVLAKHFDNKLYKKFDTAAYNPVFDQILASSRKELANPKVISAFYKANQNNPILITRFFSNGELDSLKNYLARSNTDGFNPEIFNLKDISALLSTINANQFKSIDEVYPVIAALEVKTADVLLKYTTFMKYGSVNPRKFSNRFYINLKRPDSAKLDSLLHTESLIRVLKDAQQTDKNYLDLKQQLQLFIGIVWVQTMIHPLEP